MSVIPSSPNETLLSDRLQRMLNAVGESLLPSTAGQIHWNGLVSRYPLASFPNPAGEYLTHPSLLLNETFLCISDGQ